MFVSIFYVNAAFNGRTKVPNVKLQSVPGYVDKTTGGSDGSAKGFQAHIETRHKIKLRIRSADANDDTPNDS